MNRVLRSTKVITNDCESCGLMTPSISQWPKVLRLFIISGLKRILLFSIATLVFPSFAGFKRNFRRRLPLSGKSDTLACSWLLITQL